MLVVAVQMSLAVCKHAWSTPIQHPGRGGGGHLPPFTTVSQACASYGYKLTPVWEPRIQSVTLNIRPVKLQDHSGRLSVPRRFVSGNPPRLSGGTDRSQNWHNHPLVWGKNPFDQRPRGKALLQSILGGLIKLAERARDITSPLIEEHL